MKIIVGYNVSQKPIMFSFFNGSHLEWLFCRILQLTLILYKVLFSQCNRVLKFFIYAIILISNYFQRNGNLPTLR